MKISVLFLCCIVISISGSGQMATPAKKTLSTVTTGDELRALYDLSRLPFYRDHTVEAEVSSYDTTGGNDDGFKGTYSYIRRNADSSLVIFDVKGPGVINRIWTPTPTDDTLDLFIDDSLRPVLSIQYGDLFSHKVFPFVAPLTGSALGGYYCYFPILFQHRCEIICRGKKMQFHQIGYRLYPPGTVVKSFSPSLSGEETEAIRRIAMLWDKPGAGMDDPATMDALMGMGDPVIGQSVKMLTKTVQVDLHPGETKTALDMIGGGRILGIELDRAAVFEGLNKDLDIRITWDHAVHPAVYCPVADLFGYAFGKPAMQSLLLGTRGDHNYCYFPMPFDKSARIEFCYRVSEAQRSLVSFRMKIYYTGTRRDPEKEGKFYASWHVRRLSEKDPFQVLLQAEGKGHYVGTLLQAQGLRPGMTYFFEGDDSTATDGLPRMHGTGSEDYFNGGWYAFPDRWDGRRSLPIHGCLDYSLPFCRTGGYRFYLSDKIPFERSIFQSMEHGPDAKGMPAEYTSVGLYYCDSGVVAYQAPSHELSTVYVPDTLMIYPQLLSYTIWGDIGIRSSWTYPTGGLSFQYTVDDQSRLKIYLPEVPAGRYTLLADLAEYDKGCVFAVWQGQSRLSDWIDTHRAGKERVGNRFIGDVDIRDSLNSLTLTFRTLPGANELFLNRFILVRQK